MKRLNVKNLGETRQQGFTIIELIVVILLLGILTATALPRFLDVTDEAHVAVVDAVRGGLVTGGALFHAQWIAEGQGVAAIAEFGNLEPINTGTGYPSGTAVTLNTHADCVNIFDGLLQSGRPAVSASLAATGAVITNGDLIAGADFTAALTAANVCTYAYTGQFASTVGSIPLLDFSMADGSITTGAF